MKQILKAGAPWIVAAIAVAGFLLTRADRAFEQGKADGSTGSALSGRVTVQEGLVRPLTAQVGRLLRYQAAHYQWERMVSDRMGWPPPPNPDEMAVKDGACGAPEEPAGILAATP